MFNLSIGKAMRSDELVAALKAGLGEFNFPQVLMIENKMPFPVVDSAIEGLMLDSNLKPNGTIYCVSHFADFGQLVRFADNMLALSKLNGFDTGIVIQSLANSDAETAEIVEASAEVVEATEAEEAEKPARRGRKAKAEEAAEEGEQAVNSADNSAKNAATDNPSTEGDE